MLPSRFEYHRPESLEEALSLLAEHGDEAKVLAGGQSLIPLMKLRFAAPAHLIDVNRIARARRHRRDRRLAARSARSRATTSSRPPTCSRHATRRWPRPRRRSPTRSCATSARSAARSRTPTRPATGAR